MDKEELTSKIILGEITGKNQAIHAYDKMIWTVRTGFLTLFFASWGILLKSIVDNSSSTQTSLQCVLVPMLFISITLSIGGLMIDQNYVRRKFRVIHALDSLLLILMKDIVQIDNNKNQIIDYIQVSGDKDDKNYQKVSGYRPAWRTGLVIYLVPLIITTINVLLLWK